MRRTRSTNPELLATIRLLRKEAHKNQAAIWRVVADRLSSSRRRRLTVNLSRLNRYTQEKETVIVPGKVLGTGRIDHPLSVAAFAFSTRAKQKIIKAKGKCLSISRLVKDKPNGSSIKLME